MRCDKKITPEDDLSASPTAAPIDLWPPEGALR